MNLSGTLSDWTVADLLNVMKVTGKTASLHIRGRRSGVIHFSGGRVVGADMEGESVSAGELQSRSAASETLFVLSRLEEGTFEVGPFQGSETEGWDVDGLLSDMGQLAGLEADLAEAGMRDSLLMLRDEITQPITIQVEDWWALASLVSVLSFDQLEEVFGRGRAIRLLHSLWRLDLMETVDEEASPEGEERPVDEPPPMVIEERPAALDLSEFSEGETAPDQEDHSEAEPGSEHNDESWLDEIAAEAGPEPSNPLPKLSGDRNVMGVSAPASTVLTGAVLDEMRRLRVRPPE